MTTLPTRTRPLPNVRANPMFAASAVEGVKRRATLSDTENLAVGAFGGVLETCLQSASPRRSLESIPEPSPRASP